VVGGDSGVAVAVEVEESGSVSPKEVARALSATVNSGPAAATAGVEEASTRPTALAATITSAAVARRWQWWWAWARCRRLRTGMLWSRRKARLQSMILCAPLRNRSITTQISSSGSLAGHDWPLKSAFERADAGPEGDDDDEEDEAPEADGVSDSAGGGMGA